LGKHVAGERHRVYHRKPACDPPDADAVAELQRLEAELRRTRAALESMIGVVRTVGAVVAPYGAKAEAAASLSLNRRGLNSLRLDNAQWRAKK
jgi:hypothetical protein